MFLILISLFVMPVHADLATKILSGCEKLTQKEWVQKYDQEENEVIEALEKDPKLSRGSERDFFEVVYPQDLPDEHPMRGAFTSCFTYFETYKNAKNNTESVPARKNLEMCYARAYKKDPPKVIAQYMDCLKKIKN